MGRGLPSAEQVKIDWLCTPMVAPPPGVTRKILGGTVTKNSMYSDRFTIEENKKEIYG